MKRSFVSLLVPFCALLIYGIVQILCSLALLVISLVNGDADASHQFTYDGTMLSWALLVSSVLTIVFLHAFKFINVFRPNGHSFVSNNSSLLTPHSSLYYVFALTLLMFASNLLTEWMNLENNLEQQFLSMATTVPGMLAIGVVGPITEEYVFREAIQGGMLRNGVRPWIACVASALVFGIIHMNPAQIPFAFMVGLAFAYVYYRTRSIIPVMICHIINNGSAVVLMNIYSDQSDITFRELIGSDAAMIVCFALSLIVGLLLLWKIPHSSHNSHTSH